MPFNEALFWFGLTAFGTGLYFAFEGDVKIPYSVGLVVVGLLGCIYSVYRHYHPESLKPIPLWMILLAITWALVGYDVYLRQAFQPKPIITEHAVAGSDLPTYLRLQFNANNTIPTAIDKQNVWRWYALRTTFSGLDRKTNTLAVGAQMWSVFIVLDKPISFDQILVDGAGSTLPGYEVKDSSNRTAVVIFSGDLVGVVVNIRFANSKSL
jgi:hypothetical protein